MTVPKMFSMAAVVVAALSGQAAKADQTVTVMSYSGIFQERYVKAVIEPFMASHPGIKVEFFALPNSAQMLGTLRARKASPQVDVAILDVAVSKAATDEGLFVKLDEKAVPAIADLYPAARIPEVAGVGVTFDNLMLVYNAEAFKEPPKTWQEMIKKEYRGKVAMNGMPNIEGLGLVLILDKARGGTDYMANVDKGIAALGEIAPNVQTLAWPMYRPVKAIKVKHQWIL